MQRLNEANALEQKRKTELSGVGLSEGVGAVGGSNGTAEEGSEGKELANLGDVITPPEQSFTVGQVQDPSKPKTCVFGLCRGRAWWTDAGVDMALF